MARAILAAAADAVGAPATDGSEEPSLEARAILAAAQVVAVGVELLADALRGQAVDVEPVDWRPPAPGTEAPLRAAMADPRRSAANAEAIGRVLAAGAQLVDRARVGRPRILGVDESLEVVPDRCLLARDVRGEPVQQLAVGRRGRGRVVP